MTEQHAGDSTLPSDCLDAITEGEVAYTAGDLDKAARLFEHAIALDPTSATAHSNLGVAYLTGGRVDDAIRVLELAHGLAPNDTAVIENLIAMYGALGQSLRAEELKEENRRADNIPRSEPPGLESSTKRILDTPATFGVSAPSHTPQTGLPGQSGGAWTSETHNKLYGPNLNTGLGDFLSDHIQPSSFLEFGAGLCGLANYVGNKVDVADSFCLEPDVQVRDPLASGIQFLNLNILTTPAPQVLNRFFDLVLSIEVLEHVPRDNHDQVFDFLVSRAGRVIVFSAARPGQGGHGHVAERPESEWREELTGRGCRFNPELTALARSMSNERNINHRRNLQVFEAPERTSEICALEERAIPYLSDLKDLVLRSGDTTTGNLFFASYFGMLSGRPEHALLRKRENLARLASEAEHILEVGFLSGHSSLLMLLASPRSRLTIIDPCEFTFTRPCADYLSGMFPGRIDFIEGYSTEVLPRINPSSFNLVHLDGGKGKTIAQDLDFLKALVRPDHVVCVDDTQNSEIRLELDRRIRVGEIEESPFQDMNESARKSTWTHAVLRFCAT